MHFGLLVSHFLKTVFSYRQAKKNYCLKPATCISRINHSCHQLWFHRMLENGWVFCKYWTNTCFCPFMAFPAGFYNNDEWKAGLLLDSWWSSWILRRKAQFLPPSECLEPIFRHPRYSSTFPLQRENAIFGAERAALYSLEGALQSQCTKHRSTLVWSQMLQAQFSFTLSFLCSFTSFS